MHFLKEGQKFRAWVDPSVPMTHGAIIDLLKLGYVMFLKGKGSIEKKRFLSGIARMMGGGLPMPEFFGPLSRSAFLVNKKSLFLQKCQRIELLTGF